MILYILPGYAPGVPAFGSTRYFYAADEYCTVTIVNYRGLGRAGIAGRRRLRYYGVVPTVTTNGIPDKVLTVRGGYLLPP